MLKFLTRWLVSSVGLWLATGFLGTAVTYDSRIKVTIIGGLVLALVNIVIKPILVIFSLPVIVFTLGLFTIIINGLTVYIASLLYAPLGITNFWAAVFAGMVIGLVNYLVTTILKE
jgi:putative membrane protein